MNAFLRFRCSKLARNCAAVLLLLLLCFASHLLYAQAGQWAFMGGDTTIPEGKGPVGVYGTLGQFAAANRPGGRSDTAAWMDSGGRLWLFGGLGYDSNTHMGSFNDLWEFDPKRGAAGQWAWMGGTQIINQAGVAGDQGQFSDANLPAARSGAVAWTDQTGRMWLFGGDFNNDLWVFDPARGTRGQWAWMGGKLSPSNSGVYGKAGQFAATNMPGGRVYAVGWVDQAKRFWLFGGFGKGEGASIGYLNDLWVFDPVRGNHGQWAWMGGAKTLKAAGVYGARGRFTATNMPGARDFASTWTARDGRLWLLGGKGYDAQDTQGYLNDLWVFDPSLGKLGEWALMGGSTTVAALGSYGTFDQFSADAFPGARIPGGYWSGKDGHLWLFGGAGMGTGATPVRLNDVWDFDPALGTYGEWGWSGGGNVGGNLPSYGSLGQFAPGNDPGALAGGARWTDPAGRLWLFGGQGADSSDDEGFLNTLWKWEVLIPQSISFAAPKSPVTYGVKPIGLSATATSKLPVTFTVLSGPGKLTGNLLTVTGAGTIAVVASQPGNSTYNPATQVTHSIAVNKASLVVVADDKTIKAGAALPSLTWTAKGLVNGDSAATALKGAPALATTATPKSPVGLYAITIAQGTQAAANYVLSYQNGTLLIAGAVIDPYFLPPPTTYTGPLAVTIHEGSPGAKVYYTADGSTPSATHGTLYTGTITLKSSATLKAIGILAGCTPSTVVKADYTIH
ncbi:MAG: MBG domain-containing protein [Terracidiphilus sp.]